MYFLAYFSQITCSFQYSSVFFFFSRDFLASLIFNGWHLTGLLGCLYPVFMWYFLAHWGLPQQRDFPSKKIPQRKKKSALLQERRGLSVGDHRGKVKTGVIGSGLPGRRMKLNCPRTPLLSFLKWDASDGGPSYPHSKGNLDTGLLSSHLRGSPANVSREDVYSVGMIPEDGSAWMISCLDLAGTFSIYSNFFQSRFLWVLNNKSILDVSSSWDRVWDKRPLRLKYK